MRAGVAPRSLAVGALAVAISAGIAVSSIAFPAAAEGRKASCRGPGSLAGSFELAKKRKVSAKRTNCRAAKKVVKRFPKFCADAFAAQGKCRIRARGRWRCRSKIVGSALDGGRSQEKCRRGRARVKFQVAYFPPTEPDVAPRANASPGRAGASGSGVYNAAAKCVDTTAEPGTVIPPPNPSLGRYEIHVLPGVPVSVGEDVQAALVAHRVPPILHAGLGSDPRNVPSRIPIFLTPTNFHPERALGVAAPTCRDDSLDAIIVRTDMSAQEIQQTAAHELFHAYSFWPFTDGRVAVPWWEEASATWSEGKVGLPEERKYDNLLQFPLALDSLGPPQYPYTMGRFVQFLDARGFIGGPAWPFQREVISGYRTPGATLALSEAITNANSGTSLGEQLAAFWGDRLRATPSVAPDKQLKPGANARRITVDPGVHEYMTPAGRLDTDFTAFKLNRRVERVEFEFDPPARGYYWGLVSPNDSRRFRGGDSVSFCVDGEGPAGELEWAPSGRDDFPVTFTNGDLSSAGITGKITVRARTDREQCKSPTSGNRACKLLRRANVGGVLGSGQFPFASSSQDSESRVWICFYTGSTGEVNLNLIRALQLSARQVRNQAQRQIAELGLDRLPNVGDLAGIGVFDDGETTYALVVMAVGKEVALFTVGPGNQRQNAITLAKRIAGELD